MEVAVRTERHVADRANSAARPHEVPRKNGKSTIAAGVGLYLAFFDEEPGAAATKRAQAKILWEEARRMVLQSPSLRRFVTPLVGNLHARDLASKFEPLGADTDSTDGLNIHAAIIDELHAHKTRAMWDVLETAMGSRRQPLVFTITTAGNNRASLCYEQHEYVRHVLNGTHEDDSYFGVIYTWDAWRLRETASLTV
jgi:phage terminase large subunit-like protein